MKAVDDALRTLVEAESAFKRGEVEDAAEKLAQTRSLLESLQEKTPVEVESSNIHSIGYDPSYGVLKVRFKGGGCYYYYHVPESLYSALMESDSKGKFLHKYIKNTYPFIRVED